MARPRGSTDTVGRSTLYVHGELDPPELAFFAGHELQVRPRVPDSARVEALGHGVGYWAAGRATSRASSSVQEGQRVIQLALAAYTALGGTPFRVRFHGWVEARGVTSRANVIGFHNPRFGIVQLWDGGDPRNLALRQSVEIAGLALRRPLHRIALRDLHAAYLDASTDAFVFAFRAVEEIRQTISPGRSSAAWRAMHAQLGTSAAATTDLANVAHLVRHGRESHPDVRAARGPRRRRELLAVGREVVQAALADLVGRPLATV